MLPAYSALRGYCQYSQYFQYFLASILALPHATESIYLILLLLHLAIDCNAADLLYAVSHVRHLLVYEEYLVLSFCVAGLAPTFLRTK